MSFFESSGSPIMVDNFVILLMSNMNLTLFFKGGAGNGYYQTPDSKQLL